MSKKADDFYFNNFIECAEISCETAEMLKNVITNFNFETLPQKKEIIHSIEHRGDEKRHEMISQLVRAFITPIERDDMIKLSNYIDSVTDSIEDIFLHIYVNNVSEIRSDIPEFADILIRCCNTMKELLIEFRNFKKSKKFTELIIELNSLEGLGDELYISGMKRLHTEETDPLTIIAWREIYDFFEKSCDACEEVANIIEIITIGNI